MDETGTATTPLAEENASRRKYSLGCAMTILFLLTILSLPLLWRQFVRQVYNGSIYTQASAPIADAAIVFGAAVYADGRLSSVLRDRMDTAIDLYKSGKVGRILVSGDNQADHYDEPGAMKAYAIARGVPASAVEPDQAGLRTYDTCYRAREIFGIEQAVLVTQTFHLPRALFTCRGLGLDAVGVSADQRPYRGARWYEVREIAATLRAAWDVVRREPPPLITQSPPFIDDTPDKEALRAKRP
jgi:SanA protein